RKEALDPWAGPAPRTPGGFPMNPTDATVDHAAPLSSAASLDDPQLVRAMEEYAELLQTGPRPDRSAFLARHVAIADVLVRCLDGLEFVHAAGHNLSRSGGSGADGTDLLLAGVPGGRLPVDPRVG